MSPSAAEKFPYLKNRLPPAIRINYDFIVAKILRWPAARDRGILGMTVRH
jgi:hypothetical protein